MTIDATRRRAIGQILLLSAGFFVLVAISALSVVLVTQSRKDNRWVVHTIEVENQVNALLLDIRRAESAVRGYMLSSAPQFLTEQETAVAAIRPELDRLTVLTADNPVQVENIIKLRQAIEQRLSDFANGIERVKNNDVASAAAIMRGGQTSKAVDAIAQASQAMRIEEDSLFAERTKTADRT